jgi:sulfate transport system permease protein
VVALVFIGLPFVVRTCSRCSRTSTATRGSRRHARRQPLADVPPRDLPIVLPALLTGFALAFARGVGEYGSVIFIAGNLPIQVSEIAPLLIIIKLEEYDYAGATAIAA